jgi:hypothetical protein
MLPGYFVNSAGQIAGILIEFVEGGFRLPGASANDLLNSQNNWMKSIALERHFLLTLCCCRQKVSHSEGILCEKRQADAARDASKRSVCFLSF